MKFTHSAVIAFPRWIVEAFNQDTSLSYLEMKCGEVSWWIKRQDVALQGHRIFVACGSTQILNTIVDFFANETDKYRPDWLQHIQKITPEQAVVRLNIALETLKQISNQPRGVEPHAKRLAAATVDFIENCL